MAGGQDTGIVLRHILSMVKAIQVYIYHLLGLGHWHVFMLSSVEASCSQLS